MANAASEREQRVYEILSSLSDAIGGRPAEAAPAVPDLSGPAAAADTPERRPLRGAAPRLTPLKQVPELDDLLAKMAVTKAAQPETPGVNPAANEPADVSAVPAATSVRGETQARPPASPATPSAPKEGGRLVEDAIISEQAASSVKALLGELVRSYRTSTKPDQYGAMTTDNIVQMLLEPMLQQWVKDHLPVLVERIVHREIENLLASGFD